MDVPKLKSEVLTERITLAVRLETKKRLQNLKVKDKVDITEWIRNLIDSNLPALEESVNSL